MSNYHASTVNSFFSYITSISIFICLSSVVTIPKILLYVHLFLSFATLWTSGGSSSLCLSWPVRGWLMGHVQRQRKKYWRLGVHRTKYWRQYRWRKRETRRGRKVTKPGRHVWRRQGQRRSKKAHRKRGRRTGQARRRGKEARTWWGMNRGKKRFNTYGLVMAACLIQYKQTSCHLIYII